MSGDFTIEATNLAVNQACKKAAQHQSPSSACRATSRSKQQTSRSIRRARRPLNTSLPVLHVGRLHDRSNKPRGQSGVQEGRSTPVSQFCMSGDFTIEATNLAVNQACKKA